jgi:hypothetical protein
LTDADAETLAHYIDHGYVVFPKATDESVIDEYLTFFESAWDDPPDFICSNGRCNNSVAFQTMTMRKGSEENLHIDTGPLTLTEPMSMAASLVALEDVQPQSGEFQFIPGSHRLPELLHYGTDKGHNGDYEEYDKILQGTLQMCDERGLKTKTFMAKKGDALIWHADLMHGGAPIQDQSRTRLSSVAHFMPLGVMPMFSTLPTSTRCRTRAGGTGSMPFGLPVRTKKGHTTAQSPIMERYVPSTCGETGFPTRSGDGFHPLSLHGYAGMLPASG